MIVLADIGGNMAHDSKIDALNQAMRKMIATFRDNNLRNAQIKLAVIGFSGSDARLQLPFTLPEHVDWEDLEASGATPMGAAFTLLTALIEDREAIKARDFRPIVILISDGQPTDDWQDPLDALNQSERAQKADRFALAIGKGASTEVIKQFVERARGHKEARGAILEAADADQILKAFKVITMSVSERYLSSSQPDLSLSGENRLELGL